MQNIKYFYKNIFLKKVLNNKIFFYKNFREIFSYMKFSVIYSIIFFKNEKNLFILIPILKRLLLETSKTSIVSIQFSITVYITIVEMSIWNSNQSKVVKERAIASNCIYLEQTTTFYMQIIIFWNKYFFRLSLSLF